MFIKGLTQTFLSKLAALYFPAGYVSKTDYLIVNIIQRSRIFCCRIILSVLLEFHQLHTFMGKCYLREKLYIGDAGLCKNLETILLGTSF